MFMSRLGVQQIVEQAIRNKKVLKVTYQHVAEDVAVVTRTMAPFDIGTTNPRTFERNKNNLYMFCYEHQDRETGMRTPMVHPINIEHVVSIVETGQDFDPIELIEIHKRNSTSHFDYRNWQWAIVGDRNWF